MADSETVFTFFDTRGAIVGEKTLQDAGVRVRVMSRPSALGDGCGICLRVDDGERERARELLREAGIAIEAAFAKTRRDGGTEYAKL